MKTRCVFLAALIAFTLLSCKKDTNSSATGTPCGDHQGHQLYKDSSGDCYYLDNGNRVAVETHECNC